MKDTVYSLELRRGGVVGRYDTMREALEALKHIENVDFDKQQYEPETYIIKVIEVAENE